MTRPDKTAVASYAAAFCIPMAIVVASLAVVGLYPFGDTTISAWDLQITYTYFYEWFQNVLQGKAGLFYSFSKSLGGNMFAGYTNICASPLLLPLAFMPGDNAMPYTTFVMVLRFGLAGVAALFWLRNRFELAAPMATALSICYAHMLFMTSQAVNPLWMDTIVVLPLVLLGIYRVVANGKTGLFFASLLACIIVQWYNGYMVCLFSVLFYLLESFVHAPQARKDGVGVRFGIFVHAGRFAVAYALAVAASLIVLLPTALELMQGKGAVPGGLFDPGEWYELPSVVYAFYPGVYAPDHFPQLYTGTLVLVGLVSLLVNGAVPVRNRIAAVLLVAFMIVCTWYMPLDRIWCGLRAGNGYYCRFVFLISALFVFLAAMSLEKLDKKRWKAFAFAGAAVLAGGVLVAARCSYLFGYGRILCIVAPIAVTALVCGYVVSGKKRSLQLGCGIALVAFVALELLPTSVAMLDERAQDKVNASNARYEQYFSEGRAQFEELDAADGDDTNAYRVGKTYIYLTPDSRETVSNESFVYGYSQIEVHDSAYDDRVQNMMSALGYTGDWSCYTTYQEPIPTSDSWLGVRYVAAGERPATMEDAGLRRTQDGNVFYLNPYALPLGFGIDATALDDEPKLSTDKGLSTDAHDPFENQNAVLGWLTGDDVRYWRALDPKQTVHDDGQVTWTLDVPEGGPAYAYVRGSSWLKLLLTVDDTVKDYYLHEFRHYVFNVSGEDDAPSIHEVKLAQPTEEPKFGEEGEPRGSIAGEPMTLLAYQLDMAAFSQAVDKLASHPFDIDTFEDGHVRGTYASDGSDVLFTTIPYDAGWQATVNGTPVETRCALGTFLAVPVEAGDNVVELRYHAPGFAAGALIAGIALILFIVANRLWARQDDVRGGRIRRREA